MGPNNVQIGAEVFAIANRQHHFGAMACFKAVPGVDQRAQRPGSASKRQCSGW